MAAQWLDLDDSVDPAWWRPLEALARLTAADPALPAVDPDQFLYLGQVQRTGCTPLHVYRNVFTRRFVNVDEDGQLWRYTNSDRAGIDRYAPIATAEALERADLDRGNRLAGHTRAGAPTGRPRGPGATPEPS